MLCEACKHCVPCFTWGRVKCLKKFVSIEMRSGVSSCEDFEKDDGFEKHERKCQCNACLELEGREI
jgi:hypothetical protein